MRPYSTMRGVDFGYGDDTVFVASGERVIPIPRGPVELSAEVELAGIPAFAERQHILDGSVIVADSLNVMMSRAMDEFTMGGDNFQVFRPGGRVETTVSFTTTDHSVMPGKIIQVRLPPHVDESVLVMRTERRGGLVHVEGRGVSRSKEVTPRYSIDIETDQIKNTIRVSQQMIDDVIAQSVRAKRTALREISAACRAALEHPNCRCLPVTIQGERKMAPKNTKMPKFYVASTAISRSLVPGGVEEGTGRIVRPANLSTDYVKYTEKEAVEMARQLVEKDGEARYIVKIVKVVRRRPQPVVVESVK